MSVRIQFDITDEEFSRMNRYIPSEKTRHSFGYIALMEWIKRHEGRDERLKRENEVKQKARLEPIIMDVLRRYGMVADE